MGKTRADIQKAYRERKKAREGNTYLKKETERVKSYYKPTTEIGPNKLRIRRERARLSMQKLRQKVKKASDQGHTHPRVENDIQPTTDTCTTERSEGPCDSTTDNPTPSTSCSTEHRKMIVQMNFGERRGRWKRSKTLKKAENKVKKLELQIQSLRRNNNKLRKRLERVNSSNTPKRANTETVSVITSPASIDSVPLTNNENTGKATDRKRKISENTQELTPKSKSISVLRSEGLNPRKHKQLVKQLTYHHSIVAEVKSNLAPDRGRARQRSALQIVCGNVLKRYRLASNSSRVLGVNRSQISKTAKAKLIQKRRKVAERVQISNTVTSFLQRDDNSACLPGKRDKTKTKHGITQTRVLNDYLYNLHLKFKSENPDIKIGLTAFSSHRPKYIKLVRFSARRTCLCQRHQNIALKVKGLKLAGTITTENPDILIGQLSDEEIIGKIRDCDSETIKYAQWKRKEVEHKGRVTKRMLIENVEQPKNEFIDMFKSDLAEFRSHTARVRTQYIQIMNLKERMPINHAVCQMDFAENYSCGHADEIQNAYFDKCSVTLHPVVIYTKNTEGEISHNSHIYVSDTPAHNSGTVYAFMKRIIDQIKSTRPDIVCIHYVTDSPTSQYRNKNMMYLVANHDQIFGAKASWQYWEAGHGKGPCDGVGGSSKRLADLAVKRHIAVIQSAEDYYHWGYSLDNSQIKYFFVPKDECDKATAELSCLNMKAVKGTLYIHSVVHLKTGEIAVRNTSCFCENCFVDGDFKLSCDGWNRHVINQSDNILEANTPVEEVTTPALEPPIQEMVHGHDENFVENSFVAAVYNGHWYIGKIIEYDPEDDSLQYHISFMEHGKGKVSYTFKWPNKDDKIWIAESEILCAIDEPVPYGTRKMYKLHEADMNKVISNFAKYK